MYQIPSLTAHSQDFLAAFTQEKPLGNIARLSIQAAVRFTTKNMGG
jgi:hypothetical protein